MRLFRFLRANASYLIGLVAALGLGFALGDAGVLSAPMPSATPEPTVLVEPVGQIGEISVLPTTQIVWKYYFTLCGEEYESSVHPDITGLTLKDITDKYPGAKVLDMTSQKVVVQMRIDEYCPDHYVLVMTDQDVVCIFKTNPTTYESEQVMQLDIDTDALEESVRSALYAGIPFDSLEQIDAYLEDVES
ncbi:MAG: hypothetical protein AAGU74_10185 [Bacillota bacterium]